MKRIEKKDYWREQVALWEASGKSQKAFCREQELVAATFSYWKNRLAKLGADEAVEFFPLAVPVKPKQVKDSSGIVLAARGGVFRLELETQFCEEALRKVLHVLEEL